MSNTTKLDRCSIAVRSALCLFAFAGVSCTAQNDDWQNRGHGSVLAVDFALVGSGPFADPAHATEIGGSIDAVRLMVAEVRLHHRGEGWISLESTAGTYDLLDLEGLEQRIAEAQVPAGEYTQIRLVITDAEIVVDGDVHELEIPSGEQSGFKIHVSFCLDEDEDNVLTLEWDVAAGLHHNAKKGYWLTPSVHIADAPSCAKADDDDDDDEPVCTTGDDHDDKDTDDGDHDDDGKHTDGDDGKDTDADNDGKDTDADTDGKDTDADDDDDDKDDGHDDDKD
jgi:hypothetical protein